MIEEPYRWLDAIANRREYVREQLKGGTPVLAASLADGVLLLGVGTGQSKVFELFDRQALAGLGHPADLERIRQAAIDAAHLEAFNRAPEDVTLRRLVAFGLSPQLKTSFEQVASAPILAELILAELGPTAADDLLVRLHFDGAFEVRSGGVIIAAADPAAEARVDAWLRDQPLGPGADRAAAADLLLQAWWCLQGDHGRADPFPTEADRRAGWRQAVQGRAIELGWLDRRGAARACFRHLTPDSLRL
jgi:proteasome alpha subunit